MRPPVSLASFVAIAVVQTSFFASLPGPLAHTPLVLATGVYLVQHADEWQGAVWIVGFGAFLDLFAIPSFPAETFSYAVAAAAAYLLSRHLLSNRSWYGLVACGAGSALALHAARFLVLSVLSVRMPDRIPWDALGASAAWNAILSVAVLTAYFVFSKRIRSALSSRFLLAKRSRTPTV